MDFKIDYRKIEEMSLSEYKGLKDPFGVIALTPRKRRVFLANPFLSEWNDFCQMVASSEGVAFGGEIKFPLLVKMPDGVKVALGGSTTSVAKPYRKTGVGACFGEFCEARSPGHFTCGSSMSQMMVKVLQYLNVKIMLMPRFVMLFKSQSVVKRKLAGSPTLSRILCFILNNMAMGYYAILFRVEKWKTRKYFFDDVAVDDSKALSEVATLIVSDSHPFAEVHDERWLKWVMTETFSENGPLKLTRISKDGQFVGFYMTKKRFYEQASARGFKNVWLASIMEWGCVKEEESNLPWFLLHAALSFRRSMDAFELVTADGRLQSFFHCLGAQHVGDGNYQISAPKEANFRFENEMNDLSNWRLRPAMVDAPFN